MVGTSSKAPSTSSNLCSHLKKERKKNNISKSAYDIFALSKHSQAVNDDDDERAREDGCKGTKALIFLKSSLFVLTFPKKKSNKNI